MSKIRLIALAAGTATLLITTGTALAIGSDDTTTPAQPALPSASASSSASSSATETSRPDATPAPVTGRDQAIQTALAATGGGTVTEVEAELEHGRVEWKIRIVSNGHRVDVRVDAATGTITRFEDRADQDTTRHAHPTDDHPSADDRSGDDSGHGGSGHGDADNSGGNSGHGSSGRH